MNFSEAFIEAVKGIAYKFGSTRLLALGMYLLFLTSSSVDETEAYLGGSAFVLVMILMMVRPHAAHKEIK